MIANALGPGAYSAAQVSRKLRQLGLRLPRKQKPSKGPVEEEKTVDSGEDEVMLATLLKRCVIRITVFRCKFFFKNILSC